MPVLREVVHEGAEDVVLARDEAVVGLVLAQVGEEPVAGDPVG